MENYILLLPGFSGYDSTLSASSLRDSCKMDPWSSNTYTYFLGCNIIIIKSTYFVLYLMSIFKD